MGGHRCGSGTTHSCHSPFQLRPVLPAGAPSLGGQQGQEELTVGTRMAECGSALPRDRGHFTGHSDLLLVFCLVFSSNKCFCVYLTVTD